MADPGTEPAAAPGRPNAADAENHPDAEASGGPLDRSLTARLRALVELTRLPRHVEDEREIAGHLLERVVAALGAVAGSVATIEDGRLIGLASHRMPPALEALQRARPVRDWGFTRRFEAGATAFVEAIEPGTVSPEILAASEAYGIKAYAAFAIRDEDQMIAVLIAGFDQAASTLPFDDRTIEAIGRVVEIAFANERLRQIASASEERYRTVFERSPDALLVLTPSGSVAEANTAAGSIFRGDIVGRTIAELADVDPAAPARAATSEGPTDRPTAATGVARRLDGTTFPVEVETTRIEVAGDDRTLALVRDLTDRERLQQELLQAQKMEAIGLLTAGVAHELNNPLASIVAFSQLIRTDPHLPEDLREHADLLIQESDRTRRIVQNLLDFARQRPPERVETSLRELVDRVLALQSYTFGPGRIEVVVDIPDDLPLVALDRAQIQQVLINLTLNAAQAITADGGTGTITVRAGAVPSPAPGEGPGATDALDRVRIVVSDTGPGIPEELRSSLFVPFFSTRPPGQGTGLGLSVSFGIAAAHGGMLRFEPAPDGSGATFVLELPIEPPAAEDLTAGRRLSAAARGTPPSSAMSPRPDRPVRVLVLDDEASIRDFLVRVLRRAGYEPVAAVDGDSALDVVRNDPPDAILCDHRMAGMSGTAFHEAVAELDPTLARRFAFMSGDVLNPELRDFAVARGIPLVAKPFDIDSVGRTVAQLLQA